MPLLQGESLTAWRERRTYKHDSQLVWVRSPTTNLSYWEGTFIILECHWSSSFSWGVKKRSCSPPDSQLLGKLESWYTFWEGQCGAWWGKASVDPYIQAQILAWPQPHLALAVPDPLLALVSDKSKNLNFLILPGLNAITTFTNFKSWGMLQELCGAPHIPRNTC